MLSPDARQVRFGLGYGSNDPVLFDLAGERLVVSPTAPAPFLKPDTSGLDVTGWKNTREPKLGGTPLSLDQYERSRSLAVLPDASGFVLGANWSLRAFARDGTERWKQDVPATAWGVNVSQDGNLVVAAYGDGTIRWHRVSDGQELLALFVHAKDKRWVAWTPKGYYTASAGGEDLIGWHVNRGWSDAADFFPASRFRDRFNRPDIVKRVLDTRDEAKAVTEANRTAKRRTQKTDIRKQLPPIIKLLSHSQDDSFKTRSVTLRYRLRSPSGLPVTKVQVLIDGRPTRGLKRVDVLIKGEKEDSLTVELPARDVQVSLVAYAGGIASVPADVSLKWAGRKVPRGSDLLKPKLYALVIGVSKYDDDSLQLKYAAKDARDFAAALKAQHGGLYGDVTVQVITDKEANRDAIIDGLDWLDQEVTSRDMGLLFMAGHGLNDKRNNYYFMASDTNTKRLRSTGVSKDDIQRAMRDLAGKSLVFLDTCHSGNVSLTKTRGQVDVTSFVNELASAENGVVAYASSTGREVSQEHPDWQNGAFTEALLEGIGANRGIRGKADFNNDGSITIAELDAWLANRVKELTRGSQHPVMTKPANMQAFPIAIAR